MFNKDKSNQNKKAQFPVLEYMKKQHKLVFFIIIVMICENAIFMVSPFIYKYLIDTVITDGKTEFLIYTLVAYFVAYLFVVLFGFIQEILKTSLIEKTVYDIRLNYYSSFKETKYKYQSNASFASVSSILLNEINDFTSIYINGAINIVINLVRIILAAIILCLINIKLFLILLVLLPIYILLLDRLKKPIDKNAKEYNKIREDYTGKIAEGFNGSADILLFEKEKWDYKRLASLFQKVIPNRIRSVFLLHTAGDISYLFYWAVMMVLYYFGALAIDQQTMTLGVLLLYVAYMDNVYTPSRIILSAITHIRKAKAISTNYITKVSEMKNSENKREIKNYFSEKIDDIMFEDIFFEYENSGFNIHIPKILIKRGESIGLAGKSGEGKSTILKIIAGLYKPKSGEIYIDGNKVSYSSLINNVSVYMQSPFLFDIGVEDNLAFSDKKIDDLDFIKYVYSALEIDEFIQLPISELSGGQYQRIALARALTRDAHIYIFDEPTTNLDITRRKVFSQILRKLKDMGKIIIISSHNNEEIKNANTILLIQGGRIIQSGTHKQLIEGCDEYINLV